MRLGIETINLSQSYCCTPVAHEVDSFQHLPFPFVIRTIHRHEPTWRSQGDLRHQYGCQVVALEAVMSSIRYSLIPIAPKKWGYPAKAIRICLHQIRSLHQ